MNPPFSALLWAPLLCVGLCACSSSESDSSDEIAGGGGAKAPESVASVPSALEELQLYLAEEQYLVLPGESAPHESSGPHFGQVQTYLTPSLVDSLEAGAGEHPVGSAAVKELYGSTQEVQGHAVMVKVAAGMGAETWYFFEEYRGSVIADGVDVSLCSGCHAAGQDFVLTPFPLQ